VRFLLGHPVQQVKFSREKLLPKTHRHWAVPRCWQHCESRHFCHFYCCCQNLLFRKKAGKWNLEKVSYDWRDKFDPERNASFWTCKRFVADCSGPSIQLLLFLSQTCHKQLHTGVLMNIFYVHLRAGQFTLDPFNTLSCISQIIVQLPRL